jgi:hypothetical protein
VENGISCSSNLVRDDSRLDEIVGCDGDAESGSAAYRDSAKIDVRMANEEGRVEKAHPK